jgi:hypothetical protein
MIRKTILAALAAAACLLAQIAGAVDPQVDGAGFHWFQLGETRQDVVRLLGQPKLKAGFGSEYEGWQFQIGDTEEGEYSHHAVFRKADNQLVSIARDYNEATDVDRYFPPAETRTYTGPENWHIRVRRLDANRFLLAMGVAKPGDKTTQIVLLSDGALRAFYPWLHEQVTAAAR